MKRITTTLSIVIISIGFTFGQFQSAVTESGKKVILKDDGTWEYTENETVNKTNLDPNDCSNWIITQEDKVTGRSITSNKETTIVTKDGGKYGFGIDLFKSGQGLIILSIKAFGASSCIDEGAKINILFTDNTRLELLSDGDFNCNNNATVYFGDIFGKKKQLLALQSKRIDIMRVWTNDGYVEEKFEPDQSEQLSNALNCLLK